MASAGEVYPSRPLRLYSFDLGATREVVMLRHSLTAIAVSIAGPSLASADCRLLATAPAIGTHFVYAIEQSPGNEIDPAFAQTVSSSRNGITTVRHWMEIDEEGHPVYDEPAMVISTVAGIIPLSEETLTRQRRFRYDRDPFDALRSLETAETLTLEVTQTLPSSANGQTLRDVGTFEVSFIGCDTSVQGPGGATAALFETRYDRLDTNGGRHATVNRVWIDPEQVWLIRTQSEGSSGFTRLSRMDPA